MPTATPLTPTRMPTATATPTPLPPTSTPTPLPPLDPPPAPPMEAAVPKPQAAVTAPNLRVLPWAGFQAAISFTFDDSQPSHAEHWPELQALGFPLTFFVNPSNNWQFEYDKTWSAIAASGSELGNHTWNHCHSDLSKCTPVGSQADEIDKTTQYMVESLGVKQVYTFAAPYGDAGWNEYAAPRFLLGRGVQNGWVRASGTADWYNLPVFPVIAGMTAQDFNKGIDFARQDGHWTIYLFHTLLPSSANWYAGVQMQDLADSAAYARAFGDIWMDTFLNIGAYARAQQMFEKLTLDGHTWAWTLLEHFPPGKVLRVTVDGGTLLQRGTALPWDPHGYYQVALDAGELEWRP